MMKWLLSLCLLATVSFVFACSDDSDRSVGDEMETVILNDLKTWIQNGCDCEGRASCDDGDLNTTADDPEVVCLRDLLNSTDDLALLNAADCYIEGVTFMAECSAEASSCVGEQLTCEFPDCASGTSLDPLFVAIDTCGG